MAFSVSPSVIVREVDASASVPAIATPPAAIAGVFRWGPVGEAVLVSSENELVSRFGTPDDDNYETFFVAADYLSYANALWVARADNGAVTATADSRTYNANNVVTGGTAGSFDALYAGELGNSLEVAYVKESNFESSVAALAIIPETRITGVGDTLEIKQTIAFNASNTQFEVAPANRITTADVGDIFVIGNDSVGYQELSVTTITEEWRDSVGDVTANTSLITAYAYDVTFGGSYLLAESALQNLTITRKWAYANLFGGKKPATGSLRYNIWWFILIGGVWFTESHHHKKVGIRKPIWWQEASNW